MAKQLIHHRTPEFRNVLAEVFETLKYVFDTKNDVVMTCSSGTGAMETAVVNLVPRGGKAIVLESGKFAERWRKIGEAFGVEVVRYEVPWGDVFDPREVERLVAANPDASAVFGTLLETSTGVGHDVETLGKAIQAGNASSGGKVLWVVDGISGAGAMECRTDAWGIDVLVAGSQKALMTPPGLAFLSVSPDAWAKIEANATKPAFYFDLLSYRKSLHETDTPFTPATGLVLALAENLRLLKQFGRERMWARVRRLAEGTQAGVQALGMRLVASRPGDGMTAAFFPEGVDGKRLLGFIFERFGVKLAGGQGALKGKIFRIAHMGIIDELDIISALAALEMGLAEQGIDVPFGTATGAANRVFAAKRPG